MTGPSTLRGSTLVVTLSTLVALSLMAAFTLLRVMPRIRMAYQNAAWQEARVAAEAGVDCAMGDLMQNATGFTPGAWAGWQQEGSAPATGGNQGLLGLLGQLTGNLLGTVTSLLSSVINLQGGTGPVAAGGTAVNSTAPMYLDNLKVSAAAGVPAEVDIRLWGLEPTAAHAQWFRIRAMATCALPPTAYGAPAELDAALRRFSLHSVRPSLRKDDAGKPSTVPLPNVSRTVEALVEPILPFELAIWTGHSLSLAPTGAWNVDSFKSTDHSKSNAGLYPGPGSPLLQANGSIACGAARPYASRYGPLIMANGASVSGAVATNGGDDPSTDAHENVMGSLNLNPARIRDDFTREMPVVDRPSVPDALAPPLSGAFVAGTATAPTIYHVPGTLTKLRIKAPAGLASGEMAGIAIMIDGSLDLSGPLIVPPSVVALLFVRGNITFRDSVNSGPWSSNRAAQLLVFGDADAPAVQSLQVLGDTTVCAAFYGPQAKTVLDGAATWIGSLAVSDFSINGGGSGGVHYDEALATVGVPVGFRISRYIEDVRE